MADGEKEKINQEMADALEEMDKALSGENAEFLEKVLKILKNGKVLSGKQETRLEALYERYFGEDSKEGGESDGEEDGEDIDEDDFV